MAPSFFWIIIFINSISLASPKIVEGHLKTLENWVFLARFCFLSRSGRYEYHIEFEKHYGDIQLLLYYDDKSQWPSVYKTGKTCQEKLSVLSSADNQIVTLSARSPYNFLSGCTLKTSIEDDTTKKLKAPSLPQPPPEMDDINSTYFDQFLEHTTEFPEYQNEDHMNESLNAEIFNVTTYPALGYDVGEENELENNTHFLEYAEELFRENENITEPRVKRSFVRHEGKNSIVVSCSNAGGFLTSRRRWWYIAIANCQNTKGMDVKYKFQMTNGHPGDFWHEHLSADEIYIPPILLVEVITYSVLLFLICVCAMKLKARHLFHCTYRLFFSSAFLQYNGVLFEGVAWAKYAITGSELSNTFGLLLQGASEITFLTMLLLMAKGYTITRARLSTCSTMKLMIFINLYTVIYVSLFIYREEVFDPGLVLNLYESPAGLGLAGLRCFSWGAFMIAAATTVKKFPEKSGFYYPFGIFGSLWILGAPALTFIGITLFDSWVRESVMCGVLALLAISGHSAFLWITWPSRSNSSFPYHVRTNQISFVSSDERNLPRHVYESQLDCNSHTIIPLSRTTEELLDEVYNSYLQEKNYYHSNITPNSHISFPDTAEFADQIKELEQNNGKLGNSSKQNDNIPETDIAVDSGHPSLDASSSSNSRSHSADSQTNEIQKTTVNNPKKNPFQIAGVKGAPNKIILDPIAPPIKTSPGKVPKHLFAARRPKNEHRAE